MCQSVILRKSLEIILDEFGLADAAFYGSGRSTDISDARSALASLLYLRMGLGMRSIAAFMRLSVAGVSFLVGRAKLRVAQSAIFSVLYRRSEHRIVQLLQSD